MKIHRFYYEGKIGNKVLNIDDGELVAQWSRVLRFRQGQIIDLFNEGSDVRYRVVSIAKNLFTLEYVGQNQRLLPGREVVLFWSVLKKDKNEWVIQKCTELGIKHFVPLIAERSEKTGYNVDRARKIIVEAAEQCGRADVPELHDVMTVQNAISVYKYDTRLLVGDQFIGTADSSRKDDTLTARIGIFVGPEGGWSESEKRLFAAMDVQPVSCSRFTLRAETACVALSAKLLQ